jgi:Sec-independent protein translocase protein TatA
MKSLVQKMLLLSVAVAIAIPLAAQDKEKKRKKNGGGDPQAITKMKDALASIDLKEDQKKKIDEIVAEYTPKLKDAAKAAGEAPRKVREAQKAAKDSGKKGKELQAAVKEGAKLTPEEQTAMDKLDSLGQDFRRAVSAVLTDEQKEKAGLNKGKKKKNA